MPAGTKQPRESGKSRVVIREGTQNDVEFLWKMLYEAAYWRPDGERPPFNELLKNPDLSRLLENWGRTGDTALVAETKKHRPIGAVWFRYWTSVDRSYGYVANDIPELGIAVIKEWRGRGVGRQLIRAALQSAHGMGIEQLSLSVERDNPAQKLYESEGFKRVGHTGNSFTMVAQCRPLPHGS